MKGFTSPAAEQTLLLSYINDESYRRRILVQLNRGDGRHQLSGKGYMH